MSSLSGGQVEGEGDETDLPEATPPLAINSQNRTIFFYASATRSLMRGSLDKNVNSEVSYPIDLLSRARVAYARDN